MNQKQLFIPLAIFVMALTMAACNPTSAGTTTAAAAQISEISIKAADYSFDAPEQIEAGLVKVKLVDFSFVMPPEINAGPQVWEVVNQGPQPHEIMIVKLAEGKTMADIQTFMQSPHARPGHRSCSHRIGDGDALQCQIVAQKEPSDAVKSDGSQKKRGLTIEYPVANLIGRMPMVALFTLAGANGFNITPTIIIGLTVIGALMLEV